MFTYFENGITDTVPQKTINLSELAVLIANNNLIRIESIRELKKRGDNYYKKIKNSLPYITPNCTVKIRNLSDKQFDSNFLHFSNYIYIDIDKVTNIMEYKEALINKYKNLASLICISPGGDGITILFKIANDLTKFNFEYFRNRLIQTILQGENVDPNSSGIGRAMFISYDPGVFVNYQNQITIDIDEEDYKKMVNQFNSSSLSYNRFEYHLSNNKNEMVKQSNSSYISSYNRLDSHTSNNKIDSSSCTSTSFTRYKIYNIDEVLSNICIKTIVPVSNPIVDFKEVECIEPYIHYLIPDGRKHKTYYSLIHQWYYLNPDIEIDYLFSYLFFINNTRAKPRMEMKELVRFFNSVIEEIQTTGQIFQNTFVKRVHFNSSAGLSKKEKQTISARLNGVYQRSVTIDKIIAAKKLLQDQVKKITNRAVAELIQMDVKTVGKYINSEPIDMVYEVSLWN